MSLLPAMKSKKSVHLFSTSLTSNKFHWICPTQSSDSFSFDVTNGISGLQELVFHFRILPKTLYIDGINNQ